ncbi:helix-turn-helix domain-containing protein [Paenisporosarcina sp. OV554]|uniref:helix-turn-helix domain-containing protein n=1 Tax=Paenisporosarcina sp. OV554 TaxID=2135694 RepID=UPI000D34EF14|nr:helix-turn-helix domain-containing protein [Paenisporosarcina sp. OV554]PUB18239.1 helix-turn-helix protein [Paenisporosarcina sp. OV554]
MINLQLDENLLEQIYKEKVDDYLKSVEKESMFMTFNDLVKYLNMSNVSIREYILWRNDFPKIRLGRKFLFPRKEVANFMEKYLEEVRAVGGDIHAMKRHKNGH